MITIAPVKSLVLGTSRQEKASGAARNGSVVV